MQLSRALLVVSIVLAGCGEDQSSPAEPVVEDCASSDTSADSEVIDSTTNDTSPTETKTDDTSTDTSSLDTGIADTGATDTGLADTGSSDTGKAETGPLDTGSSDTGASDTGADATPADPCSPLPSGLTTWTKTDSASVGTPDTYFFDVNPGDPFCASITGGGSGSWSVTVSNGTSTGVYCSGSPKCSIVVPPGQLTLLTTAVTDDIGGYTLTVHYKPR